MFGFGASRLSEVAKVVGKSLGAFKKGLKDLEEIKKLDEDKKSD